MFLISYRKHLATLRGKVFLHKVKTLIGDAISIYSVQSAHYIKFGGECHVDFCRKEKNDRVRLAIMHICQSCVKVQKERHYGKNKIE